MLVVSSFAERTSVTATKTAPLIFNRRLSQSPCFPRGRSSSSGSRGSKASPVWCRRSRSHRVPQEPPWALFSQATYSLSSRVSLTGGVRYSDEQKDIHNVGGVYRLGTAVLANPASFYDFVDRAMYRRLDTEGERPVPSVARDVRLLFGHARLQERRTQRHGDGARRGLSARVRVEP